MGERGLRAKKYPDKHIAPCQGVEAVLGRECREWWLEELGGMVSCGRGQIFGWGKIIPGQWFPNWSACQYHSGGLLIRPWL